MQKRFTDKQKDFFLHYYHSKKRALLQMGMLPKHKKTYQLFKSRGLFSNFGYKYMFLLTIDAENTFYRIKHKPIGRKRRKAYTKLIKQNLYKMNAEGIISQISDTEICKAIKEIKALSFTGCLPNDSILKKIEQDLRENTKYPSTIDNVVNLITKQAAYRFLKIIESKLVLQSDSNNEY